MIHLWTNINLSTCLHFWVSFPHKTLVQDGSFIAYLDYFAQVYCFFKYSVNATYFLNIYYEDRGFMSPCARSVFRYVVLQVKCAAFMRSFSIVTTNILFVIKAASQ